MNTSTPSHANTRLAVLGGGVMGGAILEGALRAGRSADDVAVTVKLPHERERWEKLGVRLADDNADAVRGAELVLVGVKPNVVPEVLAEIADALPEGAVVASIAAGVTLATLESALPAGTPVVRVMPNIPAVVGRSVAALSPGGSATDEHVAVVRTLLDSVGSSVEVAEKDLDAVTAVSGSGPAYVFALAEAMIDGGVMLGLTRQVATQLALETVLGAATMLTESDTHPTLLREQVVSPGGTTAAALREFSRGGLHSTVLAGMEACHARSKALGG
ncbi:MAG: pyrroline-5-carboxylate reductase [Dermatophilus congolensis]|nr:pyrroline-5-carboxylate reductase [Dermatophilus congolensis]